MVRNPAWTRDELILACDLVWQNGWAELCENDPRVRDLSTLLRSLPIHEPRVRDEKFRSLNSVSRKTTDIATRHPDYTGKPTRGGSLDGVVLDDFRSDPAQMHAVADQIRRSAASVVLTIDIAFGGAAVDMDEGVLEGGLLEALYYRRERSPRARKKKIAQFLRHNPRVYCEVCGFDFEAVYGERGKDYIECHHIVPLHVSGETETKLADLILLCSNCHRMVHRGPRWRYTLTSYDRSYPSG
ncbi:HNH endonuclease [Nocardia sp. NBC_01503]|uniref:HNH endonuclease n=1 Tax=Nocardia sp. NBC_01503 TaxID=2975997 RepID=UPI002E7B23D4|nr:HNH endonuclease [Nocardia sp. NBC_01503]WTL32947.1 HNH endonuclease [Nocardia sp. NBC_01503]